MSLPLPNDRQVDFLREVANIGSGQAANALSRLMGGKKVDLSIPRVLMTGGAMGAAELLDGNAPVVSVAFGMSGDALNGDLLLILPHADASALESLLLGGQPAQQAERDSVMAEVANIAASAFLSAVGRLTSWKLMPTVPEMHRCGAREALEKLAAHRAGARDMVVMEACFQASTVPPVNGQVLWLLERESAHGLYERLGG
ncbi:chemotaxis protein CheC [Pyxidicoccus parkwayensis]|uniref:Chemotaxis protein CheC n=1 Tax=Pyxidicoccus parkwayensis TaxID=2813578 RepID=A0ABX7NW31_9BACT|nr:chemotaxis protein CheC [Pyxidicoccus parkwaysis]QSQ22569.1 chemotaxis protein CheC [Pyxidicoccus parkwaysis]